MLCSGRQLQRKIFTRARFHHNPRPFAKLCMVENQITSNSNPSQQLSLGHKAMPHHMIKRSLFFNYANDNTSILNLSTSSSLKHVQSAKSNSVPSSSHLEWLTATACFCLATGLALSVIRHHALQGPPTHLTCSTSLSMPLLPSEACPLTSSTP